MNGTERLGQVNGQPNGLVNCAYCVRTYFFQPKLCWKHGKAKREFLLVLFHPPDAGRCSGKILLKTMLEALGKKNGKAKREFLLVLFHPPDAKIHLVLD
jgi:hypothetical protein